MEEGAGQSDRYVPADLSLVGGQICSFKPVTRVSVSSHQSACSVAAYNSLTWHLISAAVTAPPVHDLSGAAAIFNSHKTKL